MNWIDLLQAAVDKRSQATVSKEVGLSRTTIHMILKGTYGADTKNVEKKVLAAYGKTACPFLRRIIDGPECREYRERPVPMSHREQIEHWQHCQICEAPVFPEASIPERE